MVSRPMMPQTTRNVREELVWLTRQSRAHERRTMRQFAEQEVIIPDGPYAGRRFRCSRQPYSGLWFDAIDSGLWSRYVGTGPTQSGKTLSCFVIPLLYLLFEVGETVMPAVGRGAAQQRQQWYNRPTSTGSVVRHIGEGFHINLLDGAGTYLAEVDANHWKSWVHQRLATPMGQPGAMTLFAARPSEHLSFAKHLTAETKTEEYVASRGVVTKWERVRKNNHWFDALYNACALGHYAGVRLLPPVRPPKDPPRKDPPREPRDGRRVPFVNLDGWHFPGRERRGREH